MTAPGDHTTVLQAEVAEFRRPTRRGLVTAGLVTLGAVGLYVANAAMHGALGASRNDDWAYLRVAFRFVETGQFSLDGWTQMLFVGQAWLAWPVGQVVGSSIAAMQLLVALMAWVGVLACYLTLRSFVGRVEASFAVAVLLVGPVFGSLATSFMTDVPSFCFQMLTLLFASRLITNGWSHLVFLFMCLSGVLATSIREYGVVVLAISVMATAAYCRPRDRQRTVFVVGAATSALIIAVMLVWRSGVANGDPDGVPLTWAIDRGQTMEGLRLAARASLTLALFVVPVAALVGATGATRRMRATPWRVVSVLVIWVAVGLLSRIQWVGNYVTARGSYGPPVQGSPPAVLSPTVDLVVRWIAYGSLLAVLLVVGLGTEGARPGSLRVLLARFASLERGIACRWVVVATVFALAAVHLFLLVTSNTPFYDRYLIVFVPVLVAGAASMSSTSLWPAWRWVVAGVLLVGLGLLGMRFVDASSTVDGARWRYASRLVDSGYPAESIDAGFEWFNFHQEGTVDRQPGPDRNAWTMFYPSSPVCVTVVAGSDPVGEVGAGVPALVARSAFGVVYRFNAVTGPSTC